MTFEIPTGEQALEMHLTLEAKKPCVVSIIGYDSSRKNTIYFNRGYGYRNSPETKETLLSGKKVFKIPMPLSPKTLSLKVTNDVSFENVGIIKADAKPLNNKEIWLKEEDRDFISFAFNFAQKAGTLAANEAWISDSERYMVKYLPVLKNRETGEILSTPARINRRTGIIEIAKDKFIRYTVFMRIIILFHEYFHYELDTRSEEKADLNAISWALDLGFPRTEIMYAFTKVFAKDKSFENRERTNILFIRNYQLLNSHE